MKYSLLLTRSCLYPRGLAITATWLLLLIFFGRSGGINTAQAQPRAYIPNPCTAAASVIDTATNTLVTTIPIGIGVFEVAITPDGSRAYVTSQSLNTVSVVDTATNTVTATIPVGITPAEI